MEFGDILDAWEKGGKPQPSSVKNVKKQDGQAWREKKCSPSAEKTIEIKKETRKETESKNKTPENNDARINPMEMWLRRYGVADKDAEQQRNEEQERLADRDALRSLEPEARIDLHGLTRDEAWSRLEAFVGECCRRSLRKILIIHGKGNHSEDNPVLNLMVRTFIERDPRLGASGHPDKRSGGRGATWVIIKYRQ